MENFTGAWTFWCVILDNFALKSLKMNNLANVWKRSSELEQGWLKEGL